MTLLAVLPFLLVAFILCILGFIIGQPSAAILNASGCFEQKILFEPEDWAIVWWSLSDWWKAV